MKKIALAVCLACNSGLLMAEDVNTVTAKANNADTPITELEAVQIRAKKEEGYVVSRATTATKTDTPIIDTPFSIQVVTEDVIQDQQAYRLEDVLKNVSNVRVRPSPYSGAYENIQSRGFKAEPFRDGQRMMFLTLPLASAERVEVLKGSAAIQYGRVEPGGMVNVVTKMPSATPHYEIEQQFGSHDFYRTTADLTGPINADKTFLYRINAEYLDKDSFVDYAFNERTFIAPSITWQPSADSSLTLSYEYRDEKEQAATGIPAVGKRPASVKSSSFYGEPDLHNHFKADVLNLKGEHEFNEHVTVRAGVGRYRGSYHYQTVVNDTLTGDHLNRWGLGSDYDHRNTDDAFIDMQAKFDTAGILHTVLLGTDYHRFHNYSNWSDWGAWIGCPAAAGIPDVNIYSPSYHQVSKKDLLSCPVTSWWTAKEQWTGIYLQDQLTIAENWHVLLGGRYDSSKMSSGYGVTSMAEAKDAVTTKREHEFSPKAGLTYKVTPWLALYGSYTEAFGGTASTARTVSGEMLKPEASEQYEIGAKTELLKGGLVASVALYDLTKKNIKTTDLVNPLFSKSIGEAKSKGIEFDVSGKLSANMNVIASYAYNDVSITKSNDGDKGNRLPNAPRNSGSVWLTYNFLDDMLHGLSIGGGVFMADQVVADTGNTAKLPGYVRLDAYAAYKIKLGEHKVTAQLNVNNLLDKKYYTAGETFSRSAIFVAEPLNALGSIKFEF